MFQRDFVIILSVSISVFTVLSRTATLPFTFNPKYSKRLMETVICSQVLMLEKTRIIKRPEGEPTFHVFYQMLAGIDSQLRKELQLENLGDPNLFMTPLQRVGV